MPTTPEAVTLFLEKGILFSPGKASNAGGVSTSGLEMSQNSGRIFWSAEEVDKQLHTIMVNIHQNAYQTAKELGKPSNYVTSSFTMVNLRINLWQRWCGGYQSWRHCS